MYPFHFVLWYNCTQNYTRYFQASQDFFMGKCTNHPDRETNYHCQKQDYYLCEECLHCKDPELYCKFRSACPIWFIYKERIREARQEKGADPKNDA